MGLIVSLLFFSKDGFELKLPTKVDMPLKRNQIDLGDMKLQSISNLQVISTIYIREESVKFTLNHFLLGKMG